MSIHHFVSTIFFQKRSYFIVFFFESVRWIMQHTNNFFIIFFEFLCVLQSKFQANQLAPVNFFIFGRKWFVFVWQVPKARPANYVISKFQRIVLNCIKVKRQNLSNAADTFPPIIMISANDYLFARQISQKVKIFFCVFQSAKIFSKYPSHVGPKISIGFGLFTDKCKSLIAKTFIRLPSKLLEPNAYQLFR